MTYCTDPRCTTTQRCWRAENEDFGNAHGVNYGPRCAPLPDPDEVAQLRAEVERLRAQRVLSNEDFARSFDMGLAAGERRERAAVVAWLRGWADRVWHEDVKRAIVQEAYVIERGEHRREEGA